MTYGLVRERLNFSRAEWDALPWHDAQMYLEYLEETGRARRQVAPEHQSAPPAPAEEWDAPPTTAPPPAPPAPAAPPPSVPTDGGAARGPGPAPEPGQEGWTPPMRIRQIRAFGEPPPEEAA